MAPVHVRDDCSDLAEALAEKIEQEIQADLDWLRQFEAATPLEIDDTEEDGDIWSSLDQQLELLTNR